MAKRAISKGIYENFGQTELRELKDKYSHLNLEDPVEKFNHNQFIHLENWLMNFDYEMMQRWKKILGL